MAKTTQKKTIPFDVGDDVFIVMQSRSGITPQTFSSKVIKRGTKWAYVNYRGTDEPFSPVTGCSVHQDPRTRMNCFGFDVYTSEAAFQEAKAIRQLRETLPKQLVDAYGRLKPEITDEQVRTIHAILELREPTPE